MGGPGEERPPTLGGAEFDDLLREVLGRVHGALDERERWELLLDAVVSMAADLSLDGVLPGSWRSPASLADAQYAALGVLGAGPGSRLRTFVTHGMTPTQVQEIGDLPAGHGLLGLIIDRPEPLRLHDIAEHPASYGFPPNHPPMRSFLGVPVRIRDQVFGNLYLTEKVGERRLHRAGRGRIVVALAAAAGVAIENARLYEEAARRERVAGGDGRDHRAAVAVGPRGTTRSSSWRTGPASVAEADVAWIVAGHDVGPPRAAGRLRRRRRRWTRWPACTSSTRWPARWSAPASRSRSRTCRPTRAPSTSRPRWAGRGSVRRSSYRCAARDGVEGALALAWTPGSGRTQFHAVDPACRPASPSRRRWRSR